MPHSKNDNQHNNNNQYVGNHQQNNDHTYTHCVYPSTYAGNDPHDHYDFNNCRPYYHRPHVIPNTRVRHNIIQAQREHQARQEGIQMAQQVLEAHLTAQSTRSTRTPLEIMQEIVQDATDEYYTLGNDFYNVNKTPLSRQAMIVEIMRWDGLTVEQLYQILIVLGLVWDNGRLMSGGEPREGGGNGGGWGSGSGRDNLIGGAQN